jgi:hypothetical protein
MNAYRILEVKPGRQRLWQVDNIKMNLGEMGCGDVDWIDLARDRGW